MHEFRANLELLGINPFVFIPEEILNEIFKKSGVTKSPIPIRGMVNQTPYVQTLVKYKGAWRLYINLTMLKNAPQRIDEVLQVSVEFDPVDRSLEPHHLLVVAFSEHPEASKVFDNLSKSKQQEIIRYISRLKTDASIVKNVQRAINFLNGNERFLGRDKS